MRSGFSDWWSGRCVESEDQKGLKGKNKGKVKFYGKGLSVHKKNLKLNGWK